MALPVAQRYTGIELDLGLLQGRVIGKAWIACHVFHNQRFAIVNHIGTNGYIACQAGQFIGRMVMRQQTAGVCTHS